MERPGFSLLLKPASGDCNLRCRYCFYLPGLKQFSPGDHRMDRATLELTIRRFFACRMARYSFGWQGGEPTLMGIDFYREAVRLQQKFRRADSTVANALQTNGTLLTDAWGEFLHRNGFLTGISIDGPAALHDHSRLAADGTGSHRDVMRGVELLKRHHVEFNALTLVSAANQDHPLEVYGFLREQGIGFHQYIECVEFDSDGNRRPYALAPGKWGQFMCRIFDEWYARDTRHISIRLFDSILSRLLTAVPTVCPMGSSCCNYFVIEHNGDIFPCDFFVRPELKLGNIRTAELETLRTGTVYRKWGRRKDPHSARCSACRFLPLCMGDCPKNRIGGGSALCEDWQMFYEHTITRFEELAARRQQEINSVKPDSNQ